MQKNNKINKSVILGIIVTLGVMVTLMGLTYAYFRTKIVENSEIESIKNPSKMLKVVYEDDNPEVVTDPLYAPGRTVKKDFQVRNVGDDTGNYSIILDNVENTLERTWDIRYTLKDKAGTELVKGTLGSELKKQMVYADISIEVGELDEYTLELEYEETNEDQSIDMGKNISFKIDIIEAHENIFKDIAGENTLLYAIGRDNEIVNPKTTPGKQVSLEDEAELSYTEDDYGTSYYFRGSVKNNYVTFAGMCWRIMRVLGNGGIKITLFDESNKCEDSIEEDKKGSFINGGEDKAGPFIKYEGSVMEEKLNDWYNQKIGSKSIDENVETSEWCNDISIASYTEDSRWNTNAWERVEESKPSLRCDFVSKVEGRSEKAIKVQAKVATITSDEVMFVSGKGYLNENIGLKADTGGGSLTTAWNTMSPYGGTPGVLRQITVYGGGGFSNLRIWQAIRASIVLKSNVLINDDSNGTQETPYIISE